MRQIDLNIRNRDGLHARPAAMFVRAASGFASAIQVENTSRRLGPVNAKSILAVLTIGALPGDQIRLAIDGQDEALAELALSELVRSGLGEEI